MNFFPHPGGMPPPAVAGRCPCRRLLAPGVVVAMGSGAAITGTAARVVCWPRRRVHVTCRDARLTAAPPALRRSKVSPAAENVTVPADCGVTGGTVPGKARCTVPVAGMRTSLRNWPGHCAVTAAVCSATEALSTSRLVTLAPPSLLGPVTAERGNATVVRTPDGLIGWPAAAVAGKVPATVTLTGRGPAGNRQR